MKENFSESQKQGLFGVALDNGQPIEYYYGFRINLRGKQYTNLPSELTLTPTQLTQYYSVYKDPFVIHIRKAFGAYLKNQNSENEEFEDLRNFDSNYFQSKFIVFSINNHLGGGKRIEIIFQDRPDVLFTLWIYRFAEGGYGVRSFEAAETDARLMRLLRIRYKKFLQDKVHSL